MMAMRVVQWCAVLTVLSAVTSSNWAAVAWCIVAVVLAQMVYNYQRGAW